MEIYNETMRDFLPYLFVTLVIIALLRFLTLQRETVKNLLPESDLTGGMLSEEITTKAEVLRKKYDALMEDRSYRSWQSRNRSEVMSSR